MNWHECTAKTVLNILNSGGKSYICLNQNANYSWVELVGIKDAMILLAILFFVIVYAKKMFYIKKKK